MPNIMSIVLLSILLLSTFVDMCHNKVNSLKIFSKFMNNIHIFFLDFQNSLNLPKLSFYNMLNVLYGNGGSCGNDCVSQLLQNGQPLDRLTANKIFHLRDKKP